MKQQIKKALAITLGIPPAKDGFYYTDSERKVTVGQVNEAMNLDGIMITAQVQLKQQCNE